VIGSLKGTAKRRNTYQVHVCKMHLFYDVLNNVESKPKLLTSYAIVI